MLQQTQESTKHVHVRSYRYIENGCNRTFMLMLRSKHSMRYLHHTLRIVYSSTINIYKPSTRSQNRHLCWFDRTHQDLLTNPSIPHQSAKHSALVRFKIHIILRWFNLKALRNMLHYLYTVNQESNIINLLEAVYAEIIQRQSVHGKIKCLIVDLRAKLEHINAGTICPDVPTCSQVNIRWWWIIRLLTWFTSTTTHMLNH